MNRNFYMRCTRKNSSFSRMFNNFNIERLSVNIIIYVSYGTYLSTLSSFLKFQSCTSYLHLHFDSRHALLFAITANYAPVLHTCKVTYNRAFHLYFKYFTENNIIYNLYKINIVKLLRLIK